MSYKTILENVNEASLLGRQMFKTRTISNHYSMLKTRKWKKQRMITGNKIMFFKQKMLEKMNAKRNIHTLNVLFIIIAMLKEFGKEFSLNGT